MPFGLNNAGATYQRAMTALFHDMIHKEMEVYVDDTIVKSWAEEDREFEESVLQIAEIQSSSSSAKAYKAWKRRFGASLGKLLGFIVSRREIEVDLQKPKKLSACRYQRQRKKEGRQATIHQQAHHRKKKRRNRSKGTTQQRTPSLGVR